MYSILTTEQFDTWFKDLRDRKAKTLVQVRIDRMENGNFGDCQPVGMAFLNCASITGRATECISNVLA